MEATLSEPIEPSLREQVASGQFSKSDDATASAALESLLDEALSHPGERFPLSKLRRKASA